MKILKTATLGLVLLGAAPAFADPAPPATSTSTTPAATAKPPKDLAAAQQRNATHQHTGAKTL